MLIGRCISCPPAWQSWSFGCHTAVLYCGEHTELNNHRAQSFNTSILTELTLHKNTFVANETDAHLLPLRCTIQPKLNTSHAHRQFLCSCSKQRAAQRKLFSSVGGQTTGTGVWRQRFEAASWLSLSWRFNGRGGFLRATSTPQKEPETDDIWLFGWWSQVGVIETEGSTGVCGPSCTCHLSPHTWGIAKSKGGSGYRKSH